MEGEDFDSEVEQYIEKLKICEIIDEKEVKKLCEKAKIILGSEDNVLILKTPITVILNK